MAVNPVILVCLDDAHNMQYWRTAEYRGRRRREDTSKISGRAETKDGSRVISL
jgi:hypothetical protein